MVDLSGREVRRSDGESDLSKCDISCRKMNLIDIRNLNGRANNQNIERPCGLRNSRLGFIHQL